DNVIDIEPRRRRPKKPRFSFSRLNVQDVYNDERSPEEIADGIIAIIAPHMRCWGDDGYVAGDLKAVQSSDTKLRNAVATLPWVLVNSEIRRVRDGFNLLGYHVRKTPFCTIVQPSNLKQKLREFMEPKPPRDIVAGAAWRREMKQKVRSWRASFPSWENGDWQLAQLEDWIKRIRHDGTLREKPEPFEAA
ncbi:MAG: hypothetical protein ACR2P3_01925, partial [Geminicoccaceae bacterium]